jgi:WXG100 family type VII secretion target
MSASGGSSFHVDPAALESVIALLDRFEKRAEQFISEVDQQVSDLHVDWVGDTAARHREVQQQWAVGAAEMRTAVGQLRAIVSTAHANYGSAAVANNSMWQR